MLGGLRRQRLLRCAFALRRLRLGRGKLGVGDAGHSKGGNQGDCLETQYSGLHEQLLKK
jgi:hypothetical protein